MLLSMLGVGRWMQLRIEEVTVRNTAHSTALYMESFIAPLTQDLAAGRPLSQADRDELHWLFEGTPLGERVVSFKIWGRDGLLIEGSNPALIGQRFEPTANLERAWTGEVRADFDDLGDPEDVAEAATGRPLLEVYSPIRAGGSDRIIAVAEFYEVGDDLKADLTRARLTSWAAVACVMVLIGASLFAIVLRGSRTIDRQMVALRQLSARNTALRMRVQGAAARFAAMNDRTLRGIGADLHDGPAQLMALAALRLDALRPALRSPEAEAELDAVARALRDAMIEVRGIARGVLLPDLDRRGLADLVQSVADAHAARTGTEVRLTLRGTPPEASAAVKTCLYRAVQEGLTNAWRHADGRGQEVALTCRPEGLVLQVLDRGPGPSGQGGAADEAGRLGLAGLRDRVESLGGRLALMDRPGPGRSGGAELRLTLPPEALATDGGPGIDMAAGGQA